MGKQTKRTNRRRSGGGNGAVGRHHRLVGLTDELAAATVPGGGGGSGGNGGCPDDSSPMASVIGRIRHGDPRVRHATLVSLSRTLYDSESLANAAGRKREGVPIFNSKGKHKNSPDSVEASDPILLRALSERILEPDTPCATAATGCLSNYVSFYCGAGNDGAVMEESSADDELGVASDVMVPILLQRISDSLRVLKSLGGKMNKKTTGVAAAVDNKKAKNNTSNAGTTMVEKLWPSFLEQWSLLSLALLTLAGLIENFPKAVRRTGPSAFPQLLAVLTLSRESLRLADAKQGNESCGHTSELKREGREPIMDAATNALRVMHSLLDNNASLISSLSLGASATLSNTSPPCSLISAIVQLKEVISEAVMEDMARLHAAGAIVSLRRSLVLDREHDNSKKSEDAEQLILALQSCTNEVVVPTLHSVFSNNNESFNSPRELLACMIRLSEKLATMKQDQEMESQIVNMVNARKEPVKLIARRQKKVKKEKEMMEKEKKKGGDCKMDLGECEEEEPKEGGKDIDDRDVRMVVEDDSNSHEENSHTKIEEEDLDQQLDNVVQSWRNLVGSHKLALELVANLCADNEEVDEEDDIQSGIYHEEHELMWDSDDEARLTAAANSAMPSEEAAKKSSLYQQTMYNSMANHRLAEQVLVLFKNWVEFCSTHCGNELPALISEDVNELLSTCALSLCNMVGCDALPMWSSAGSVALMSTGKAAENGLQLFWWELTSILNSDNITNESKLHITSVTLSLLRNQPWARTLVDSPVLDCLLTLLSDQHKSKLLDTAEQRSINSSGNNPLVQMHCNILAILGVLCLEPHSAVIDAQVCRGLLERLLLAMDTSKDDRNGTNSTRHSIIIIHEILNVLMDTYGADDCHEEVFIREDVLGHIQRCLPGFRRCIKRAAACNDSGSKRMELAREMDIWSETALNASRFIRYKKGTSV